MSDETDEQIAPRPPPMQLREHDSEAVAAIVAIGDDDAEGIVAALAWPGWYPRDVELPTDDELIGRDEMLTRLRQHNVDISARTLGRWEAQGMVPRPIRKRHEGATRAVYPAWVASFAVLVHVSLQRGESVDHVARNAPYWAEDYLRRTTADKLERVWDTLLRGNQAPDGLLEVVDTYALEFGIRPAMAELRFRREDGKTLAVFSFSLPADETVTSEG